MRYVTIPEQPILLIHPETGKPIKIEDPDNAGKLIDEEPWTFWMYIRRNIVNDPDRFGEGYEGLVSVMQIKEKFENAETGDVVEIEDSVWKKICEVIDKPSKKWNVPLIAMLLLPYMDAFKKAATSKKETKALPTEVAA